MSEIPKSVQIGPLKFQIIASKEVMDKVRLDDRALDAMGEIDYRQQIIKIDPTQAADQVALALLHEVVHGVIHVTSTQDSNPSENNFVAPFSTGMLDTLRRNPGLVAYLMEEDC